MSERTPQDVLPSLAALTEFVMDELASERGYVRMPADRLVTQLWDFLSPPLDKVIAEAPDSPTDPMGNDKGADYAVARRAESILDEAVLSGALSPVERRAVHLSAPDTLSEKPGLDVERLHKMIGYEGEGVGLWTVPANPEARREGFHAMKPADIHRMIDRWSASTDSEGR